MQECYATLLVAGEGSIQAARFTGIFFIGILEAEKKQGIPYRLAGITVIVTWFISSSTRRVRRAR